MVTLTILGMTWLASLILVAAIFYGYGRSDEQRYQAMLAKERARSGGVAELYKAELFGLPQEVVGLGDVAQREFKGVLDTRPAQRRPLQIPSFETGQLVEVERLALHDEEPDENALYLNGLVAGWPIAASEPGVWRWALGASVEDAVRVTHISGWAGERCFAVCGCDVSGWGTFTAYSDPLSSNLTLLPVPLPTRMRNRDG